MLVAKAAQVEGILLNQIDEAIGRAIARLQVERPEELDKALLQAGIDETMLTQIIGGARRLSACELFILSQSLSAPLSTFFVEAHQPCRG